MAKTAEPQALFHHELRRDGKLVALLHGVPGEHGAVTVEVEVHPASFHGVEPQRQPFPFPSREQATRFVDAALDALQYLGCTIVE